MNNSTNKLSYSKSTILAIIPFDSFKEKYDKNATLIYQTHNTNVFQTKRLIDNKDAYIKVIFLTEYKIFAEAKKSLEILSTLKESTIDSYLEIFFIEKGKEFEIIFIILKYDLNLYDMITCLEDSPPKPEEELMQIFSDITSAVDYCHSKNISHCSIDPHNIVLIYGNERPKGAQKYHILIKKNLYQLIDWKYNHIIHMQDLIHGSKNKSFIRKYSHIKPFSAPESYTLKIFEENECKAMDVYALGMCILNFCGIPMKRIQSISISVQEIHDMQLDKIFHENLSKSYNWHIVEILKGMLRYNIQERWNIDQVWISLRALANHFEIPKSLEDEKGSIETTKSGGILKRFLSKFGNKDLERNSQNSDNESISNKFSFKLNTKNISLNIATKEDYKSFFNVKPAKNYKKLSYEIEDIMGCWKQIKPNTIDNFNMEIRTEAELNMEFLEFCLLIIKEKGKMNNIVKFSFISTFEQLNGDLPKFIDTNYFLYCLNQNQTYVENNLNITHSFTKNQNDGINCQELIEILKMLFFFNKSSLKCLNLILKSYLHMTDQSLSDCGEILYLYCQNLEEMNIYFSGEQLTDKSIGKILESLVQGFSKVSSLNLKHLSFGFGGGRKITDNSLVALSKTLITLSSKASISRLSIFINSLEISNDGIESLGTALTLFYKTLTSLSIIIATIDQISNEGLSLLLTEFFTYATSLKRFTFAIKSLSVNEDILKKILTFLQISPCQIRVLNLYIENMANRNVRLEKEFRENLMKALPNLQIGDLILKI